MDDLNLILRTAEGIIYQGKVKAVTSENEKGPFDILGSHANFITIVEKKVIIHYLNEQKQEITVDRGIIKVEENNIEIFLGLDVI